MKAGSTSFGRAVTFAVVLGLSATAEAGSVRWRPLGPWSETVNALVLDPRNPKTIYAGTDAGVFKSTDGAETWKRASAGMEKVSVLCLAIDPKTPATLYAGGYRGGLYKSTDGASSWARVKSRKDGFGISTQVPLRAVAVDPVTPANIMFTSLYKSTTGGTDYTPIRNEANGSDMTALAFHPKNPKIVYAGGTGGLTKTTDFGATWTPIDFGVPSPAHIKVIAVHPKVPEIVLLGTGYNGLFRSADGGATWDKMGLEKTAAVYAIALNPKDPDEFYVAATIKKPDDEATVYHTTDGGDTFKDVGDELPYEKVNALVVDPANPQVLYAGTDFGGVYRTENGGGTWEERSNGFASSFRTVRGLAVGGAGTVFSTTYAGVYRTTNDGATWSRLPAGLGKGGDYEFVGVSPGEKPIVVVGSKENPPVRSTDGGATWQRIPGGSAVRCIVPDPASPRDFYFCGDDGGLFRGAEGTNWQKVSAKDVYATFVAVAVHPKNPLDLFGAPLGGKLWRSKDGGKKWKEWKPFEKVKGSLVRSAEHRDIFALVFDPKDPNTLYAATEEDGVLRSADLGETWTLLGFTGEKLVTFALDPADPNRLAVGTQAKGVYLSTDRGATWNEENEGLTEKKDIRWVIFGPGTPASRLYVAMRGGGIHVGQ